MVASTLTEWLRSIRPSRWTYPLAGSGSSTTTTAIVSSCLEPRSSLACESHLFDPSRLPVQECPGVQATGLNERACRVGWRTGPAANNPGGRPESGRPSARDCSSCTARIETATSSLARWSSATTTVRMTSPASSPTLTWCSASLTLWPRPTGPELERATGNVATAGALASLAHAVRSDAHCASVPSPRSRPSTISAWFPDAT